MTQPRFRPRDWGDHSRSPRRLNRYQPTLEALEGRIVPASATYHWTVLDDQTGDGVTADDVLSPDWQVAITAHEKRVYSPVPFKCESRVVSTQPLANQVIANGGELTTTDEFHVCIVPPNPDCTSCQPQEVRVLDTSEHYEWEIRPTGNRDDWRPRRNSSVNYYVEIGFGGCYVPPWAANCTEAKTSAFFRLGQVSGKVFADHDSDGIQDPGEPGVEGVKAYLDLNKDGKHSLFPVEPTAVTAADGSYRFEEVEPAPGGVKVRFEIPAAYQVAASPNLRDVASPLGAIVPKSGQDVPGGDLGLFKGVTVTGEVYADKNGNGKRDAGEKRMPFAEIFVDADGDGLYTEADDRDCPNGPCNAILTNEKGEFLLVDAGPGSVRLLGPQPGFSIIQGRNGYPLASGVDVTEADFGVTKNAVFCRLPGARSARDGEGQSICGRVYLDYNGNGKKSGDKEDGLPGVLVYVDANNDGAFTLADMEACPEEPDCTSFTDEFGLFTIQNVVSGVVRVEPSSVAGKEYEVMQGKDGYAVGSDDTADFGLFEKVTVSGFAFDDSNGDGKWQKGKEAPIAGVTIEYEQNGVVPRTLTDANGKYEFKNVGPGPIRVSQFLDDGSTQTLPTKPEGYIGKVNKSGKPVMLNFGRKYACGFRYANGVFEITGTGKADVINVGVATKNPYKGKLVVKASCGNYDPNALTQPFQTKPLHALTTQITFRGGDGDDRFEDKTANAKFAKKLALLGEKGNDTLKGGMADDTLSGGEGQESGKPGPWKNDLDGGSGTNTLEETLDAPNLDLNADFLDILDQSMAQVGLTFIQNIQKAILSGKDGDNKIDATDFIGETTLKGAGGNDSLYGTSRGDVLEGGPGLDGLFGGYGTDPLDIDTLNGGPDADRFIAWENRDVADFVAAEDARIYFKDRDAGSTCLQPFLAGAWNSLDIMTVDQGLGALHVKGNVKLLRSHKGDLTFERLGAFNGNAADEGKVAGCNDEPRIVIAGTNFNADTVIHEIGHNWDDVSKPDDISELMDYLENFRALSGWRIAQPGEVIGVDLVLDPDFKQGSREDLRGDWWHYYPGPNDGPGNDCSRHPNNHKPAALCPAEFYNPGNKSADKIYARNNPMEDFAEHFEAYFKKKRGDSGPWGELRHKLNAIEAFVNSMKIP